MKTKYLSKEEASIYEKTFEAYLNCLLELSRFYNFHQSGDPNSFTKKVGDNSEKFFNQGYFISYALGVSENAKNSVFTVSKIEELKKLEEDKMREEFNKIQDIFNKHALKVILNSFPFYKSNKDIFDSHLEMQKSIFDTYFYLSCEPTDFSSIANIYEQSSFEKVQKNSKVMIENAKKDFEKKMKSKNPYDQFVMPFEEKLAQFSLNEEMKNLFINNAPYIIIGFTHGVIDIENVANQFGFNMFEKKYEKFYLLSSLQGKNITFKDKIFSEKFLELETQLAKYKLI
jgi:hypothetical protein